MLRADPQCPNECGPLEPFAEVDIGVGVQQFGPWGCPVCHYIESDDDTNDRLVPGWDRGL